MITDWITDHYFLEFLSFPLFGQWYITNRQLFKVELQFECFKITNGFVKVSRSNLRKAFKMSYEGNLTSKNNGLELWKRYVNTCKFNKRAGVNPYLYPVRYWDSQKNSDLEFTQTYKVLWSQQKSNSVENLNKVPFIEVILVRDNFPVIVLVNLSPITLPYCCLQANSVSCVEWLEQLSQDDSNKLVFLKFNKMLYTFWNKKNSFLSLFSSCVQALKKINWYDYWLPLNKFIRLLVGNKLQVRLFVYL